MSYCVMGEGRVTGELLCDGGGEGRIQVRYCVTGEGRVIGELLCDGEGRIQVSYCVMW